MKAEPLSKSWVAKFVGRYVGRAVANRCAELEQRITALESGQRLAYCGVYEPHASYRRGQFVTRNGSLWHCNVDAPKGAPGSDSREWTLAVKRGKDARRSPAEAGEMAERIERGEVQRA